MAKYKLSNTARADLIRIHQYGVQQFGMRQADKYFNNFFDYFDTIAANPYAFPSVDFIKKGYRKCVCGTDSIYYKVGDGVVEIMAIVGRQDLDEVLGFL